MHNLSCIKYPIAFAPGTVQRLHLFSPIDACRRVEYVDFKVYYAVQSCANECLIFVINYSQLLAVNSTAVLHPFGSGNKPLPKLYPRQK